MDLTKRFIYVHRTFCGGGGGILPSEDFAENTSQFGSNKWIGTGQYLFTSGGGREGLKFLKNNREFYIQPTIYNGLTFSGWRGGGKLSIHVDRVSNRLTISGVLSSYLLLFTGCNVIPLPPKDPRAVQQLTASKPRHQRKYPLVMPNSSTEGSGSSCQPTTAVTNNHSQQFSEQVVTVRGECSYNENGWGIL